MWRHFTLCIESRIYSQTCSRRGRRSSRWRSRWRTRWRSRCSGSGRAVSVDAILVRVGLVVDVVQVARAEVQPAGTLVEVEVDRHALRDAGAVVLTRRQRLVRVVADTVQRVLIFQYRPLRLARWSRQTIPVDSRFFTFEVYGLPGPTS